VGAEGNEQTGRHGGEAGPRTEDIIHKNDGVSRGYGTPHRQRITVKVGRKNPARAKEPRAHPLLT
jgi:hypothetical protein